MIKSSLIQTNAYIALIFCIYQKYVILYFLSLHIALWCPKVINYTPILEATLKMCMTGHKEVWETVVVRKKKPLSYGLIVIRFGFFFFLMTQRQILSDVFLWQTS